MSMLHLTPIQKQKSLIRKIFLQKRKSLSKTYIRESSEKIYGNFDAILVELIATISKPIFAAYWPKDGEFDTKPILRMLNQRKILCALPRLTEDLASIEFKKWNPQSKLTTNSYFNIMEPENSVALLPNIIITPLITCDWFGNRIGYGKGYYDRYLAAHPSIITVAICYEELMFEDILPHEEHDQKLGIIITEHEILKVI